MVVDVDEWGLEVQDKDGSRRRIEAVTKVWAAGVQASPLGKMLGEQTGAPLDRAGRISVNPDLTLPGHPEVFVVGDMINLDNLPGCRAGRDPGREVRRQGDREPARPASRRRARSSTSTRAAWRRSRGSARSRSSAGCRLTGFLAWLMWLAVHLVYITGFKNRVTARAALGGQLHRPRPLRAHRHRAADLRPLGARNGSTAARRTWSPARASTRRRGTCIEATRRAELEARAAEEARLTDQNQRGIHREESRI